MLSKKGRIESSYNPQITTERNGFILANDVCNKSTDTSQLKPQVVQTKSNLKGIPEDTTWSFDNGYYSGENIHFMNKLEIDTYIDYQEDDSDEPYNKSNFVYLEAKDAYICSQGKSLVFASETFDKSKKKVIRTYRGTECKDCSKRILCTKRDVRYLKMYPFEQERKTMHIKMKTKHAIETYKLRSQIIEFVFGDLKLNKGVTTFLTRSLETVRTEFNLMSIASNLQKIWKLKRSAKNVTNFHMT